MAELLKLRKTVEEIDRMLKNEQADAPKVAKVEEEIKIIKEMKPMEEIKQVLDSAIQKADINESLDSVKKMLVNPNSIKIICATLISILFGYLVDAVVFQVWTTFVEYAKTLIPSIVLLYSFKSVMDTENKEKKELQGKIDTQANLIQTMKLEAIAKENEQKLLQLQLQGALQMK